MPERIDRFVDVFAGGGSAFLNANAKSVVANDLSQELVALHKFLSSYKNSPEALFERLFQIVDECGLSCSARGLKTPDELRKTYPKTYYSRFNRHAYLELRGRYNSGERDPAILYILLIYGFNRMLRFNSRGEFNLPPGNVDFNENVVQALEGYLQFHRNTSVKFFSRDFQEFTQYVKPRSDDFVYFDPPYLLSRSEYNKLWNEGAERALYKVIDQLHEEGIKFGISNLLRHKGETNHLLEAWSTRFQIHEIKSNYISFNDNSIKRDSVEVYITNHEQ